MPKRLAIFVLSALTLSTSGLAFGANLTGEAVTLRTLDKVTATTKDYTVKVGDSLVYGSLSVDVKHCEKRPPEDIPETYAFLQITETPPKTSDAEVESTRIFSGWMLASNPAISALDHPVYDIWVIDCAVRNAAIK